MDAPDAEAPPFHALHEVVERVLEFGEQQQALLRVLEEPLVSMISLSFRSFSSVPEVSTSFACSASTRSSAISSRTWSALPASVIASSNRSIFSRSASSISSISSGSGRLGGAVLISSCAFLSPSSSRFARFLSEHRIAWVLDARRRW